MYFTGWLLRHANSFRRAKDLAKAIGRSFSIYHSQPDANFISGAYHTDLNIDIVVSAVVIS